MVGVTTMLSDWSAKLHGFLIGRRKTCDDAILVGVRHVMILLVGIRHGMILLVGERHMMILLVCVKRVMILLVGDSA